MATPDATRLKELIERERLNLGIEYKELAARAGLAPETLRALRSSGRASSLTKRRIEDVLGWEPGSIDAILAGGEPTPVAASSRTPTQQPMTLEEALAEVARLRAENAKLQAGVDELSAGQQRLNAEIERLQEARDTA